MKKILKFSIPAILVWFFAFQTFAQKEKPSMRDTLDNKLDLSNYIINLHGFIPVPFVITEPAIGNFGLVLAPVFISPKKGETDEEKFRFPDVTALFGLYTLNNSWGAGAFRMGSFPKYGLRYRVGGGYISANLNVFRSIPDVGEKEFEFNFKTAPVLLELSKNIHKNRIFGGVNYTLAGFNIQNNDPSQIVEEIFDENELTSTLGNLGFFVDFDYRNSLFTPDKGIRFMPTFVTNGSFTGSDFSFNRLNVLFNGFLKPRHNWVSGFRAESSAVSDGTPFYAYPFIVMRGIPSLRYQGKQTLLFETEQRLDLDSRWSLVAFAGSGKAFNLNADTNWNWAGGAGFRYLVSRVFNLRGGIDIARGPEVFAYYMVLGHNWNR